MEAMRLPHYSQNSLGEVGHTDRRDIMPVPHCATKVKNPESSGDIIILIHADGIELWSNLIKLNYPLKNHANPVPRTPGKLVLPSGRAGKSTVRAVGNTYSIRI